MSSVQVRVSSVWVRVIAVCVLALTVALPANASAAEKGTSGYCPDANGVTVVVDFGDLGGDTLIRCAPGPQTTGLAALQNAGIDVTGSQKYGLAIACRLNGKPGPDTESCSGMPAANAYWSYWNAPDGGKWAASQAGAQTEKPVAGGFEGWSFAKGASANNPAPPRIAPVRKANAPAAPAASSSADSGFPWGVVIGIVVIVLVAGAALVVARRRRAAR